MHLKYNFHTHTSRCGHASGEDEEYVKAAIESGFKVLGFSDHIMLKGLSQPGIRGEYSDLDSYIKSINYLKEKYRDQIEIHLGFECEYYPNKVRYYKKLLKEDVEYLILGQHCYLDENNQFQWYLGYDNREFRIDHYVRDLIKGMSTGLFKYVAHPDFFVRLFKEYHPLIKTYSEMICEASLKYDIPLELNLAGLRGYYLKEDNFHYPNPYFWKIAGKMGVKVVIGVDAHNPEDFAVSNYQYVANMIDVYDLNFIEDFNI